MIAGGFGLWAARTGRFSKDKATSVSSDAAATAPSDDAHVTIACIPETENACASISDPLVGFSVEAPTITETQIGSKGDSSPDGWITTALGYERVRLVNNSLAPSSRRRKHKGRCRDTLGWLECRGLVRRRSRLFGDRWQGELSQCQGKWRGTFDSDIGGYGQDRVR